MSQDHFDDVDHLVKTLRLEGVHYRDFSGRAAQPRLKLIGGRRDAEAAQPPAIESPGPASKRIAPQLTASPIEPPPERVDTAAASTDRPAPTIAPSEPETLLPTESLQATFSRLIARAPAPPTRKLQLDLKLNPRVPAEEAQTPSGADTRLSTLFGRLSRSNEMDKDRNTG